MIPSACQIHTGYPLAWRQYPRVDVFSRTVLRTPDRPTRPLGQHACRASLGPLEVRDSLLGLPCYVLPLMRQYVENEVHQVCRTGAIVLEQLEPWHAVLV